jgi:two-component system sensor histidine kinase DesK
MAGRDRVDDPNDPAPTDDIEAAAGPDLAPRLARTIVVSVFVGICTIALLRILTSPIPNTGKALSIVYISAILALQLRYLRPTKPAWRPLDYATLLVQACLSYLPFLQFGQSWAGIPGFLAGSCLLVLRATWGWPAFGAIIGSMAYIQYVLTGSFFDVIYTCVSTTITGLMIYGLTRLAGFVSELYAARSEMARLAVAQERLRISRDLHDLLGYSVSAIVLKSELTHRLLINKPELAQREIADILDISRRALADVRTVASQYRSLSLDEEIRSAERVLAAANVKAHISVPCLVAPEAVRTVLAIIIRESVTNILLHSKAEMCEITIGSDGTCVEIDMVNDGVSADVPARSGPGGSGIQNLADRVARLDGHLTVAVEDDRRFRLHATLPITDRT